MAITRTVIVVLGALMYSMASAAVNPSDPATQNDPSDSATQSGPSDPSDPAAQNGLSDPATQSVSSDPAAQSSPLDPAAQSGPSDPGVQSGPSDPSDPAAQSGPSDPSDPAMQSSTSDPAAQSGPSDPSDPAVQSGPSDPSDPAAPAAQSGPSDPSDPAVQSGPSDPATQSSPSDTAAQPSPSDSAVKPGPADPAVQPSPTKSPEKHGPADPAMRLDPSDPDTAPSPSTEPSKQITTGKKNNTGSPTKLLTTAAPDFTTTISKSLQTMEIQTTIALVTTALPLDPRTHKENTGTGTSQPVFNHNSFDLSSSSKGNAVREACKTLGQKMKGNCTVIVEIHDKRLIAKVTIDADQKIQPENYKPPEQVSGYTDNNTLQKEDVSKDTIPDMLIAILASCGALVLILCCFAAYCTYHRRSYRKNQQQHLTEEMQTVENGYHDNPTLEVMEVQPEMQEKKLALNGEFNDSWIVPMDNLLKEDIPDEEDTHL
ncbi:podocalyxin-like isoform X1 [Sinocyclocheilus rhinocerous]|uniref:podocalyxin-like isoform X1 n=1 Tax=Sinocyclocheilus rhinocerous TaxID=307959 RepID=UPI0007B7B372|nr:PREDICTED: podocalyxin-like isoform X1 [Sinocyclocheilus rhinocerous]